MLREMLLNDIDSCLAIEVIRFAEVSWSRNQFEEHLKSNNKAFVKVVENTVVGFILVEESNEALHIKNIAVTSDRRGWGTELLNRVLPKSGLVSLTVAKGNSALKFYEAHGFILDCEYKGHFHMFKRID